MNILISLMSQPQFYIPFLIWSFFLKGFARWIAASKKQLVWFVLLLAINTLGLLEIIYVLFLNRWDIDNSVILKYLEKSIKRGKK